MARGRPLTPLDPTASASAALGSAVRDGRLAKDLTLTALGALVDYSAQHLSDLERGRASVTQACIGALDAALGADGALLALLRPAVTERAMAAQARAAARHSDARPPLPCVLLPYSDAGDDEEVDPTTRLGLLEAGAAAALGAATIGPAPTRAGDVDPGLVTHWTSLLRLLGRHDEIFGPREVLALVERELRVIAAHRVAARGELRTAFKRVEARWADLAAWLCEDMGRPRARAAWTDYALRLAQEADYADMAAFARGRQSKLASDAHKAIQHAEDALRVAGASPQTRAWCSRYAAIGHAMAGDAAACERHLATAHDLIGNDDSPAPPWAGEFRVTRIGTIAAEARCWLVLKPAKSIVLHQDALRNWPRAEARDGGIVQARLALACAKAGEPDRARVEGRKALAVARATSSATAKRELKRLQLALAAA
jgi:transcriptional regulator with XRE-family HTH domain